MAHTLFSASHLSEGSAAATLDEVLQQAVCHGVSDVHFESDATHFRVRFRTDGLLWVASEPPLALRDAMLTRLKVLARMDIAEKRLPQDGRFAYAHADKVIDFRVSSLPTLHSEKLVLRVLDFQQTPPHLDELGLEPDALALLQQTLQASDGMVLMTGPTGSGKTRSLYSCLRTLHQPQINIVSLEDPIEIQLPGINQVQIHERSGLTFAHALRALLRQDPDVIMVGEIRDLDTADIAMQAAQTGHLVLSTLHTPDAPSALARLQHMGVAAHHVAASVRCVVAQRLVRCLCVSCRRPLTGREQTDCLQQVGDEDRKTLRPWLARPTLYEAQGCSQCQAGYRGRIGVFQVMPVDPALQALLFTQGTGVTLSHHAQRMSVRTLRQSGWIKVLQGITTVQEVMHHTPAF